MKQNSMFPEVVPDKILKVKDERPLPLIIAEMWGFPLTYVDKERRDKDYLYCARDWYIGLGGDKSRWSNSKADWLSSSQPVMIETKRERRAPEMLEYVTEKGLYDIAQVMKVTPKNADRLQPIKDYLSVAGVHVDKERRDKDYFLQSTKAKAKHHGIRLEAVEERKTFASIATETHVNRKPQIGNLTSMVYHKLGRTQSVYTAKKEIAAQLNLTPKQERQFRDHLKPLMLDAVKMAEKASGIKMRNAGKLLNDYEQMEIVKQCARIAAVSAWDLAAYVSVDLVTEKPLLNAKN
jgi:hypothetical protein